MLTRQPRKIQTRKHSEDVQHRDATLDYRKANLETRTVPATLSSELPVPRWFGMEILRHDEASVDLERAVDGLPLLFNHDSDSFIGVVRNVRLDGGKLRGDMVFSENTRAQEVFNDVSAGLLRNVSIGYRIHETEETERGEVVVTRWSLAEASIAPVPADHTVGINRKQEPVPMSTKDNETVQHEREAEKARIEGIRGLFDKWREPQHIALMGELVADGASVDEARAQLLGLLGANTTPVNNPAPASYERPIEDPAARMLESLTVRFGIETDPKVIEHCRSKNEFGGMTIVELAREWLRIGGHSSRGSAQSIIGRVLGWEGMQTRVPGDTASFPNILADVAFKSLLKAYWDAPETWRTWTSTSSVQDFKVNNRVNLSEFDTLPVVAEGGTYTEGSFTDLQETIKLATYGKIYHITREALINDDVSAFTRIPTAMGLAAARTVGDLAYGVLTSNPTMSDANALFSAAHNNDVSVGGAPPNADTVQEGKVAMALQQGPKGEATLGLMPRYGICPVGLEGVFNTLMSAQYNPASTAGTLEPNVVQGLLTVVSDHRLDADSATRWYMAADPSRWDTVDLAFLGGNQAPYQERRQEDITNDNITFKVRIDAAAAPMDWRGMYRNAGA